MSDLIRHDHGSGIVEIVLNRAPVNALSTEFLLHFGVLMADLDQEADVRAIVLSSAFKVFSAGLDLKEAQAFDRAAQDGMVDGLNRGFLALYACSKPTVVAAGGAAIAGGLFFVLGSDVRIAAEKAKFGLAEVRVGVDFPIGPLEIARATLSSDAQRRLMLRGQPVNAQEAQQMGMVDEIEPDAEAARRRALEVAAELAVIPPLAYGAVKRQLRGETVRRIRAAMDLPTEGWFTDETRPAMRRMIGG